MDPSSLESREAALMQESDAFNRQLKASIDLTHLALRLI